MKQKNTFGNLIAFGLVTSTILAPLRLGIFEIIRPTLLIMLPCAVYLAMTQRNLVARVFYTPMGLCALLLCLLLTGGHLLGHDVFGGDSEDASSLNILGIWTILLVFIAAAELGDPKYRPGLFFGLSVGLAVHIIGMALIPPSIHYRDYGRSSGLLHDPNILTIHLVPVFFMWAALLPKRFWLLLAPVGLLPVAWATLQTLSRAGLVSLLVGVLICIFGTIYTLRGANSLRRSIFSWRVFGTAGVALVLLVSLFIFNRSFLDERLEGHFNRAMEITQRQGSLVEDRLVWLEDMQRFELSELLAPLGIGYGKFLSTDILPHNTFVDVFIIAGPVAMAAFLALFIATLLKAAAFTWRREHAAESSLYNGAILAAVTSHALILSSLSVLSGKVNWLILGLVFGLLTAQSAASAAPEPEEEYDESDATGTATIPAEG